MNSLYPNKEALAYHEAGHLLISIVCERIDFSFNGICIRPLTAKIISVNQSNSEDHGKVLSSFPDYRSCGEWPDLAVVQEMCCGKFPNASSVKEINERTDNLFDVVNLYSRNKKLTAALIFSSMAGNVSERLSKNTEEKFGGSSSSRDYKKVSAFLGLLIPDTKVDYDPNAGFPMSYFQDKLKEKLKQMMLNDLEDFMSQKVVSEAIQFIAERLLNKEPDGNGCSIIKDSEMVDLRQETLTRLESCVTNFENLLLKFSDDNLSL